MSGPVTAAMAEVAEWPADTVSVALPARSLQEQLALVEPAAAKRTNLPILVNVRLTTEGDGLMAQATDLEWGVVVNTPADTIGHLDVCVPAQRLRQLVDTFPADKAVQLDLHGTELVVRCDRSLTRLKTIDPDEFPRFPINPAPVMEFDGARLKLASDLVGWAASLDAARPQLQNVHVRIGALGSSIRFEAADGHGLAVWDGFDDVPEGGQQATLTGTTTEFLVPARVFREMGKVAGRLGRAGLYVAGPPEDPTQVVMRSWGSAATAIKVSVSCTEGLNNYPDLMSFVTRTQQEGPKQATHATATVKAKDVQIAMSRILPFAIDVTMADGKAPITGKSITATVQQDTLLLDCASQDGEEAHDEVEAATAGGTSTKYGSTLLAKAMHAVAAVAPDGEVTFNIPGPLMPTLFTPSGITGYVALVTPLDPGRR